MTEERFYYNTFYFSEDSDGSKEFEIRDKENDEWYIYIGENDSNWEDMLVELLNKQDKRIKELEKELYCSETDSQNRKESTKYWRDKCEDYEEIIDIPQDKIICKEQSVEDIAFYCKRYHDYRCIPYCTNERHCYQADQTFTEKLEEEKKLWKKLKPI